MMNLDTNNSLKLNSLKCESIFFSGHSAQSVDILALLKYRSNKDGFNYFEVLKEKLSWGE